MTFDPEITFKVIKGIAMSLIRVVRYAGGNISNQTAPLMLAQFFATSLFHACEAHKKSVFVMRS